MDRGTRNLMRITAPSLLQILQKLKEKVKFILQPAMKVQTGV
jgi:hypothetical protein